jgi:hypothetical protein
MGAPYLVERGIDPSEEGLGPALMMRLLLNMPRQGGYFRPLAEHPTMAEALWLTIRELRMAGIAAEQLTSVKFASSAKQTELASLVTEYESFLKHTKRCDMAGVFAEAMKHSDWCPIKPADCWIELPNVIWNRVEQMLIDSLPGEQIAPESLAVPGALVPRRLKSSATHKIAVVGNVSSPAFLMSPALNPQGAKPLTNISLFHAGGREAEVEEVFRRILANGDSLDQVEIACPSDAHLALIWEKALRHDWPVTLGAGIPAAFTRPGRALIGFCNWIETDFSAGHLRRLLQSGDLRVKEAESGFSAGQVTRMLARAGAGWGRQTYGLALGRLQRTYESRALAEDVSEDDRADAKAKFELTSKVREWVTKLVASVPTENNDGEVSLQAVVHATLDFLDEAAARTSALDHRKQPVPFNRQRASIGHSFGFPSIDSTALL